MAPSHESRVTSHRPCLRNRCGANPSILPCQPKPPRAPSHGLPTEARRTKDGPEPRTTSHVSRATIVQNEPNFQARRPANGRGLAKGGPAERRPRTSQSRASSHAPRVTIMQNEPNFQIPRTALIPCLVMIYEKTGPRDEPKNEPKTNPNKPNFQARRPAERRPRTYFRCRVGLPPSSYPTHPPSTPNRPSS
jgi:hypothetical protein